MTTTSPRVALYLRTSHAERTIENQRLELLKVALLRGWEIVATFSDEGISGAKGRDKRPGFDAMLKGATRREFDMIAAWGLDRLGRSVSDLLDVLQLINASGCALYLHRQALDTSTPAGRAMFQMLGVFAEFEREMIRARIAAGIGRRRAQGLPVGKQRTAERTQMLEHARALRAAGKTWREVSAETGIPKGSLRNALRQDAAIPSFLQ